MDSCVIIENLSYAYSEDDGVLCKVNATISSGKLTALFGPNGSGKSTLLKCIAGILPYRQGSIQVLGQEVSACSEKLLAKHLAYVPPHQQIAFPFTVYELVLMGRTPHLGAFGQISKEDEEMANAALKTIGIENLADKPYNQLSSGQKQLTLLARALAQDTQVLVLDEPTSALDFKNQLLVWKQLCALKEMGRTVIACTHDPNHLLWFCDALIALQEGQILAQGAVEQVLNGSLLTQLYGDICTFDQQMVRPNFQKNNPLK